MLILNPYLLITSHTKIIEGAHNGNLKGFIGDKLANTVQKSGWETCTIKFSYALNNSGINVTDDNTSLSGRNRYFSDELGNFYLISVPDMIEYLSAKYQKPENIPSIRAKQRLAGKWGLIAYGNRHFDIWKRKIHNSSPHVVDLLAPTFNARLPIVHFWEMNAPSDPNL